MLYEPTGVYISASRVIPLVDGVWHMRASSQQRRFVLDAMLVQQAVAKVSAPLPPCKPKITTQRTKPPTASTDRSSAIVLQPFKNSFAITCWLFLDLLLWFAIAISTLVTKVSDDRSCFLPYFIVVCVWIAAGTSLVKLVYNNSTYLRCVVNVFDQVDTGELLWSVDNTLKTILLGFFATVLMNIGDESSDRSILGSRFTAGQMDRENTFRTFTSGMAAVSAVSVVVNTLGTVLQTLVIYVFYLIRSGCSCCRPSAPPGAPGGTPSEVKTDKV